LTPIKAYTPANASAAHYRTHGSPPMMDVVMLAIGFAFFALSIAYVYACDLL
jgi:hypothetical protein